MILDRVVLTTGGTGGHIFPALAVGAELKHRNPDCDILFMGANGPEKELAPAHDLKFVGLAARGVMGRGLSAKLGGILWVAKGIMTARSELKKFKPQVVIGFGGYTGFCPVLAARIMGIPAAVHEQNSVPGMTNRILGKFVNRIFLSFDDTRNMIPAQKSVRTGNPVRKEIFSARKRAHNPDSAKHLLVLGGSQGARAVNDAIIGMLPKLMKQGVKLVHQCGATEEERVKEAYRAAGADPDMVRGFMDDMAAAYAWADLAVCRSGASTVFEIAAAGVPAIFVPFPHATHDHQTMNARALETSGAAELVMQDDIAKLSQTILALFDDEPRLVLMAKKAAGFAAPDAATDIVTGLEELAKRAA